MLWIPEELGVSPVFAALIHVTAFLEFSEDSVVDSQAAVEVFETVADYLQRLTPDEIQAVQKQIDRIIEYGERDGWRPEVLDFLFDFLRDFGVGVDDD